MVGKASAGTQGLGTNQLHGGLFEFVRNNDTNASNRISDKVDALKHNQFGGYVGVPILREKVVLFRRIPRDKVAHYTEYIYCECPDFVDNFGRLVTLFPGASGK